MGIFFEPSGVWGLNFRVILSLYVPVSGASHGYGMWGAYGAKLHAMGKS